MFASYVFYGWWDWRFLSLIIGSSLVDYLVGLKLFESKGKIKKGWLYVSLIFNLGLLGFFKYHNFFGESLQEAFNSVGVTLTFTTLEIILPVGISFYTFQTLSYTIDIYRGKLEPIQKPLPFFTFVAFFPQLVAGPIERAIHLLAQFTQKTQFNYAWVVDGSRLLLWGLVKKIIIADNLAIYVDLIFANVDTQPAWVLYEGAMLFAFQIYCDFSGYSDIARGVSRWFGIDIMINFRKPYLSKSFRDFWNRWHISLSTWFRDYLYIPLGGNRAGKLMQVKNLSVTFILSGLWHGANWTFVCWGILHVLYYIPEMLLRKKHLQMIRINDNLKRLVVFNLVLLSWIYFRSPDIAFANKYIISMVSGIILHPGSIIFFKMYWVLFLVIFLIIIEIFIGEKEHPYDINNSLLRWVMYVISVIAIFWYQSYHITKPFIYFQF